MNTCLEVRKEL